MPRTRTSRRSSRRRKGASAELLVYIVVSKYCDHLPLYHQCAAYNATRFSVAHQSESAMTFRPPGKAIAKRHRRYLPKTAMDKAVAYVLGE